MKLSSSKQIRFIKWALLRRRQSPQIIFIFESRFNPGNFRIASLYRETRGIEVVYIKGLPVPKTDLFMIKIIPFILRFFAFKIKKYEWMHFPNSVGDIALRVNQLIHLDDPTYTSQEIQNIKHWEMSLAQKGLASAVVITCVEVETWLLSNDIKSKLLIIPQGYTKLLEPKTSKYTKNSAVYTSAFIHYGSDKHSNHTTWGSTELIDELIPLFEAEKSIHEIVIIGEVGPQARTELNKFEKVRLMGSVSASEQARILRCCRIAIYPRRFDHKRRILKISEYAGAGLPVIAFKLCDTQDIRVYDFGILVERTQDFVLAAIELLKNKKLYELKSQNALKFACDKDWQTLALKLESANQMKPNLEN